MERIIKKDDFGDVACNDICIYSVNQMNVGRNISEGIYTNWKVIESKYYKYTDDNSVLEIWYEGKGMMLSGNLKGYISNCWSSELREEITYEEAMDILQKYDVSKVCYNNKDLMQKIVSEQIYDNGKKDRIYENKQEERHIFGLNCAKNDSLDAMSYVFLHTKQNNNGGATDYYALPENANTLQDLIEHRNMNGSVKDIFKACYRLGIKTEDELRDLNKMAYYALREIGRITGRKDYVTIAKELMGSQAIEG